MLTPQQSALLLLDWTRVRDVSCDGTTIIVDTEMGARRFEFGSEREALLSFETCRYLQMKVANSKPRQSED